MEIKSTGWRKQESTEKGARPYYSRKIGPYELVAAEEDSGKWTALIWISDEEHILSNDNINRLKAQALAEKAFVAALEMMTKMVKGL